MKNSNTRRSKAELLRQQGQEEADKGWGTKAFSLFLDAAKVGDEEAQVEVGYDYAYGITGAVDVDEALRWWNRAYKQGSWAAAFNLGMFYRDMKAWKKAVKWFERAVEAGDDDGLVEIAKIHLRYAGDRPAGLHYLKLAGKAKKKLTEQARRDFERVFAEQEALSPGNLLHMEADLLDERGRYAEALSLLMKGAELGDEGCQILLGNYLTSGRKGVKADRERGMYWYDRAYKQGCSSAACNMGLQYLKENNVDEAFRWFERAVKLKDRGAHLDLAKIWLRRRGNKAKAIEHLEAVFESDRRDRVGVSEMEREEARTLLRLLAGRVPRRRISRKTQATR